MRIPTSLLARAFIGTVLCAVSQSSFATPNAATTYARLYPELKNVVEGATTSELLADDPIDRFKAMTRAARKTQLSSRSAALQELIAASRLPCAFPDEAHLGTQAEYAHLAQLAAFACVLRVHVHQSLTASELDQAVEATVALFRLAEHAASGDALLTSLVGLRFLNVALDATGTVAPASAIREHHLAALAHEVDQLSVDDPLRAKRGLRGEFKLLDHSVEHDLLPKRYAGLPPDARSRIRSDIDKVESWIIENWESPESVTRLGRLREEFAGSPALPLVPEVAAYRALVLETGGRISLTLELLAAVDKE